MKILGRELKPKHELRLKSQWAIGKALLAGVVTMLFLLFTSVDFTREEAIRTMTFWFIVAGILCIIVNAAVYMLDKPIFYFYGKVMEGESVEDSEKLKVRGRTLLLPKYLLYIAATMCIVLAISLHTYLLTWSDFTASEHVIIALAEVATTLVLCTMGYYLPRMVLEPVLKMTYFDGAKGRGYSGKKSSLRIKMTGAFIALSMAALVSLLAISYGEAYRTQRDLHAGVLAPADYSTSRLIKLFSAYSVYYILLVTYVGALVSRDIFRPIKDLQDVAADVMEGNKERPFDIFTEDEIGDLAQLFADVFDNVRDEAQKAQAFLKSLKSAGEEMNIAAEGILKAADSQETDANEQAGALEETKATSQEVALSAKQIATSAALLGVASQKTLKACESGSKSSAKVRDGVAGMMESAKSITLAMDELRADSDKITEVAAMIREISEQTKMLAVNASLEAAGAGEAGRRFGVVASEIGRLAVKTANAVKEIQQFNKKISSSTERAEELADNAAESVEEGTELIKELLTSLEEISFSAAETSQSAHEIKLSTSQQVTALEQVTDTIASASSMAEKVYNQTAGTKKNLEALTRLSEKLAAEET